MSNSFKNMQLSTAVFVLLAAVGIIGTLVIFYDLLKAAADFMISVS
jgi:hypothetical protein